MCDLRIPSETFKDAEDGDTFKMKLSVLALDNAEVWMINESNKGLIGVPMRTGEFNYRLEARDKAGQLASAPFQVNVKPALPTNHRVQLEMDQPTPQQMATNPSKRNLLVRALARSLKAPVNSFTIQEIGYKNNKTMVAFSNNSIPYKVCDEAAINAMASKMIIKQKMRTKTEFVKTMGNQFYVRTATMIRHGNCDETVEISTTAPTVESIQEADSQLLLICVLLFLLLLIAVAIIIYCACIKKSGKKKSTSTEYVSKGLPVVFPDEVEENDPTHAGTPMLAREERPPLKVRKNERKIFCCVVSLISAHISERDKIYIFLFCRCLSTRIRCTSHHHQSPATLHVSDMLHHHRTKSFSLHSFLLNSEREIVSTVMN